MRKMMKRLENMFANFQSAYIKNYDRNFLREYNDGIPLASGYLYIKFSCKFFMRNKLDLSKTKFGCLGL
jgi:hypothetical protein